MNTITFNYNNVDYKVTKFNGETVVWAYTKTRSGYFNWLPVNKQTKPALFVRVKMIAQEYMAMGA